MPVIVKVPTQLRKLTEGAAHLSTDAGTVAAVIDGIEARHPGFRSRVLDENDQVRRFVNVYVADEDIRFLGGLSAPVEEGQVLSIIAAVAGG